MAKIAVFCLLFALVAIAHANTVPEKSPAEVLNNFFDPILEGIKRATTQENIDEFFKAAKKGAEELQAVSTKQYENLQVEVTKARENLEKTFGNKA